MNKMLGILKSGLGFLPFLNASFQFLRDTTLCKSYLRRSVMIYLPYISNLLTAWLLTLNIIGMSIDLVLL